MARVQIINETSLEDSEDDWILYFQWCRYLYDDGKMGYGYRFIWRRPRSQGNSLQAARGQARIPSISLIERLTAKAKIEGWGNYDAANMPT